MTALIQEIARAAGALAMRHYGTATSAEKADASPVTTADRDANAYIVRELRAAFPEDAILAEESKDSLERLEARRIWIVDPLDGTKEFLAENGEFSVMIGLVDDGEPVLGVVYLPAPDRLYWGAAGEGAWVVEGGGSRRLRARPADGAGLRLVGSRSHAEPLVTEMQEALGIRDVAISGSVGIKCARIAEGERDLYVHPVPYMKEWDTCAPEVILREAGGWVSDCRGEPLRYNKPDPRQPDGILACGPGCEERVLAWLAPRYAGASAG